MYEAESISGQILEELRRFSSWLDWKGFSCPVFSGRGVTGRPTHGLSGKAGSNDRRHSCKASSAYVVQHIVR
jgi:hypothetical protein